MDDPTVDEVEALAAALSTVSRGLDRARRQIPQASLLAALQVVGAHQPIRPSDMAAELGVHQSHVTRQIQALEDAGMVEVTGSPKDRRSILVSLTPEGNDELARLTDIGVARFQQFVDGWSSAEVRQLTQLLHKFEESKARYAATTILKRPSVLRTPRT